MPKISTLIITFNNADKLKDCLRSVQWTDEIVIVDGGSADQTKKIAQDFQARVFERAWDHSFAQQRNFGLKHCTGEWILQIDADERITPKLKKEIIKVLEKPQKKYYWIPFLTYFLGHPLRHGLCYPNHHLRLFQNNGTHWIRAVHEQIADPKGKVIKRSDRDCGSLKNHFLHYSFDSINHYFQKFIRYTEIDAQEMGKTKKDRFGRPLEINFKNPWSLFWFFIYRPSRFFISRFIRHRGYKDGIHGFVYVLFSAFSESVTRIKYWQISKSKGED